MTCLDAKVETYTEFQAEVTLDPGICDVLDNGELVTVQLKVYGNQANSSLLLQLQPTCACEGHGFHYRLIANNYRCTNVSPGKISEAVSLGCSRFSRLCVNSFAISRLSTDVDVGYAGLR